MLTRFLTFILTLSIASSLACAIDKALNPKTYVSPSTEWSLSVTPDTIDGDAGAKYVLKHRGSDVWSKALPFAIWDGEVTNSGVTVGFAYDRGFDGRGGDSSHINVIAVDKDGNPRLIDARERSDRGLLSNPPPPYYPVADGITVDEASDTLVVRIAPEFNERNQLWWRYRLSTGEKLGDIVPVQPTHARGRGFHKEINSSIVAGTPLVLTHWYHSDYQGNTSHDSALVQLLNLDGREVWRLDLPDEYSGLGKDWSWYYDLVEPGIKQVEQGERTFSVRSYSLKQKVSFTIEADPATATGWTVKEGARTPDELPVGRKGVEAARADAVASNPLRLLGTIKLATTQEPANPIDDVYDFSIDESGQIGFIRSTSERGVFLTVVSPEGQVVHETPLPGLRKEQRVNAEWLAPGKWLVYSTGLGSKNGNGAAAWALDISTDTLEPLPLGLGRIRTATRTDDGGFAVIGGPSWVSSPALIAFDATGKKRWEADLVSPQDVTTTTAGEIVALEGIRNQLRYFSQAGEEQRTLNLADAIGFDPNYPSGICADADGGVILDDFGGTPPIRRFAKDGKEVQSFTPKYADGRTFRLFGNVQRSPDGSLWTSDSHALLKLSKEGTVERVLGQKPGEGGLNRVRAATVDSQGRIYAVSDRDASVHVFEKDGKLQRVMRPDPADFSVDNGIGSITIAGDGEAFYFPNEQYGLDAPSKGYLHFDAQGKRVGFDAFLLNQVSEHWCFKPKSHERWALGYTSLALVGADGKILKNIQKRPSGDWLEKVESGAVAPDGSLAVIATPAGRGASDRATINVYKPDGEPRCTIPLEGQSSFARLTLTATAVLSTDAGSLQLHPLDGGPVKHFTLPSKDDKVPWWTFFVSPDGQELWGWNSGETELTRFAMP